MKGTRVHDPSRAYQIVAYLVRVAVHENVDPSIEQPCDFAFNMTVRHSNTD
jgi:hypothetical protein